jgi:anti-anti-sigma factor
VRLRGELDSATSSDLALVLSGVLGDGFAAVIDLADLSFLDLAGARLIGTASVLFRRRRGEVVLLSPHAGVARTLRMIGLEHLIHDGADYTSVLSGFAVAESISLGVAPGSSLRVT